MAVYVDHFRAPFGRMLMSHCTADSLEELHAAVQAVGIARRWFQDKSNFPHYDVCESKRRLLISNGAVEVSAREIVEHARKLKENPCRINRKRLRNRRRNQRRRKARQIGPPCV